MKTKSLFFKILPTALLLLLIVIIAFSCKKKDNENPPVIADPVISQTPNIFGNLPPTLMTNYEYAHGSTFNANLQHKIGEGLLGEIPAIPEGYMQIFDVAMEIYDHTQGDPAIFGQIMDKLNEISDQITALSDQLSGISEQLNLQTSELEQYFQTQLFNTYAANIDMAYGSGTSSGLGYYPKAAAHLKETGGTDAQWLALTQEMNNWVAVQNSTSGAKYDVAQIHALLASGGTLSTSGLMPFTKTLVAQYTSSKDAASMANLSEAFLILESYFLSITNHQFQGATCFVNACNAIDTTGWTAKNYINTDFATYIQDELEMYLYAVDYLAVNLANFQTPNKMQDDLPYKDAALSPDKVFNDPLCRAQVLSSLLLQALSVSYPCISGVIITPNLNNDDSQPQIDSISLAVNERVLGSTARDTKGGGRGIASQYYYPAWYNNVCRPDNYWNVYRFGKLGVADKSFKDVQGLYVEPHGENNPWYHTDDIDGSLQTWYFNPNNLSDCSTSRRTKNDIALAFFTERWVWGHAYITTTQTARESQYNWFNACTNASNINIANNPCVIRTRYSSKDQNVFYEIQNDPAQNSDWTHNNLGNMIYSGMTAGTDQDQFYLVQDVAYINFSAATAPSTLKAYVYGACKIDVNSKVSGGSENINIGLMGSFNPIGNDHVYTVTGVIAGDNWGAQHCGKMLIDQNKSIDIGAQYIFQAQNPGPATNITITTSNLMQVVYEGNIPPGK